MKSENPSYIGRLTMSKDRAVYESASGQAFVMTQDMLAEFEGLVVQQGHEIYGTIVDVDRDIANFRERVSRVVGERATGVLIAIPEFADVADHKMHADMGAIQLPVLE